MLMALSGDERGSETTQKIGPDAGEACPHSRGTVQTGDPPGEGNYTFCYGKSGLETEASRN